MTARRTGRPWIDVRQPPRRASPRSTLRPWPPAGVGDRSGGHHHRCGERPPRCGRRHDRRHPGRGTCRPASPAAGDLPAGNRQAPGAPPAGTDGAWPVGWPGPGDRQWPRQASKGPSRPSGMAADADDGRRDLDDRGRPTTPRRGSGRRPSRATTSQSGDRVSVEMPFGGFGRGQADTGQTLVAEQVTLLPE